MAVGDVVLDIVVRAARGVDLGTDVPGTISFRAGGSAANTCRVFCGLGGGAWFVGAVGRDSLAGKLIGALRTDGVRVHAVRVGVPTARLLVMLGQRGERSFVTQRGAADALRPADLRRSWFAPADVLHLPAYSLLTEPLAAAAMWAAGEARRRGALVSIDLASRRPLLERGRAGARELIAAYGPDLLFANQAEATALAGARGTRSLLELAPVVVIKEGAGGCRVLWRPTATDSSAGGGPAGRDGVPNSRAADIRAAGAVLEQAVATTVVETADTTGAGDAFDAGFLHSLVEQQLAGAALLRAQVLRRAAVAGHRAAARLLTRPRRELVL